MFQKLEPRYGSSIAVSTILHVRFNLPRAQSALSAPGPRAQTARQTGRHEPAYSVPRTAAANGSMQFRTRRQSDAQSIRHRRAVHQSQKPIRAHFSAAFVSAYPEICRARVGGADARTAGGCLLYCCSDGAREAESEPQGAEDAGRVAAASGCFSGYEPFCSAVMH